MFSDIELITFPDRFKELSEEERRKQRAIFLDEPLDENEEVVQQEAPF